MLQNLLLLLCSISNPQHRLKHLPRSLVPILSHLLYLVEVRITLRIGIWFFVHLVEVQELRLGPSLARFVQFRSSAILLGLVSRLERLGN